MKGDEEGEGREKGRRSFGGPRLSKGKEKREDVRGREIEISEGII